MLECGHCILTGSFSSSDIERCLSLGLDERLSCCVVHDRLELLLDVSADCAVLHHGIELAHRDLDAAVLIKLLFADDLAHSVRVHRAGLANLYQCVCLYALDLERLSVLCP